MKRLVTVGATAAAVVCALAGTASSSRASLLVNGDFEAVALPKGAFRVTHAIPGWTSVGAGPSIEVQDRHRTNGGRGSAGTQLAELCASGADAFYQDVPTTPGATYALSLDHAFRPTLEHNGVVVYWDGSLVDAIDADGRRHHRTRWTSHQYTVTATAAVTRLTFAADADLYHNRYLGGGWIDNVRLELLTAPAAPADPTPAAPLPSTVVPVTEPTVPPGIEPSPIIPIINPAPAAVPEPSTGAVVSALAAAALAKRRTRRITA